MPESLADLVAEKLGLEPEEAKQKLADYLGRLEESIRSGDESHIEDFGVFQWKDDGIQFRPDEALSQLVNYRYRSLSALPATPLAHDQVDEAADSDSTATEQIVPEEPGAPVLEADDKNGEIAEVVEGVWDAAIFEDTEIRKKKGGDRTPVSASSEQSVFPPTAPLRSSRMPYIVLPLIVVVIAAMAYFLLNGGWLKPSEDVSSQPQVETAVDRAETNAAQTTVVQDSPSDLADNGSDNVLVETGAQDNPESNTAALPPPTDPPVETTDDFISNFTRQTSGYTLVVGRSSSLERADNQIKTYSSLGVPLAIVEYEDNGITLFRLAVGRYDTVDEAQQGIQNLGSQLPGGTWIRRIRLLFSN